MNKLLAVDLDGTLFYPRGKKRCISKKNVKFLQDFIDAGNKVVLVTSRSTQFTDKLKEEINRDYDIMNCTSTQIFSNGKCIRNESMNPDDLKEVLNFLDKEHRPLAYLMTSKDYPCIIKQNVRIPKFFLWIYKIYWHFQFCYREPYVLDNDLFASEIENNPIYKLMVFFGLGRNKKKVTRELNKLLREKHPNIESSWTLIVNELTPKDCNKATGLEYYCKYNGIDKKDVIVIGDSGNDISMFNKFHENSYVMAHAYPSVKKYAKYTVTRVFKLRKYVLEGETNKHE